MKRNHNWMAPTKFQVFAACICFLQLASIVTTQTSNEPHENIETSPALTQEAFKPTTESSEDDISCPHCNTIAEVSLRMNQQIFMIISQND